MTARFLVKRASNGEAVFSYEDSTRRLVVRSQRYHTAAAARRGIESIRENATEDERYERLIARSGHTYFNLKAANGEIIGTSVLFDSPQDRHQAIEAMQREAPCAPMVREPVGD